MTAANIPIKLALKPEAPDSEDVASAGVVTVVADADSVEFDLNSAQISPVESDDTQILSLSWSINKPEGLKQPLGHLERFSLLKISTRAVVLSAASTGWPSLKAMLETL